MPHRSSLYDHFPERPIPSGARLIGRRSLSPYRLTTISVRMPNILIVIPTSPNGRTETFSLEPDVNSVNGIEAILDEHLDIPDIARKRLAGTRLGSLAALFSVPGLP